jgi:hypothetical protein
MVFPRSFNEKEKHLIDLLHQHAPGLSHKDIAEELNILFPEYNGGTRTRWGVIDYFKKRQGMKKQDNCSGLVKSH